MINVIEVYNALRDLANKDQKGFISPRVFNEFAGIAQSAVYEEMFKELADAKTLRMRNIDPAQHESVYRGKQDDLHEYLEEVLVNPVDSASIFGTGGNLDLLTTDIDYDSWLVDYPRDFARLVSLRIIRRGEIDSKIIDLEYDPARLRYILKSNLSGPTNEFPIALISNDIRIYGFAGNTEQAPRSLVAMTYYRQPRSRMFTTDSAGTLSDSLDKDSLPRLDTGGTENAEGFFVPNIGKCRNFDLPEHYKSELIAEMAKMIGIRLRDPIISQYGTVETQTK